MHDRAAKDGVVLGEGWASVSEEVASAPSHLLIDDDALDAFSFFSSISDQWRYSPAGTILGLDLTAVVAALKVNFQGRKQRRRLLLDVQAIASGVRDAVADEDAGE